MSSQSLYRKWRSQTFGEVVGQEHVTRTLLNALRSERVAHAYLFCGPRGTGKTSTARLLAKALNCQTNGGHGEPCNRCDVCRAITEGRSLDVVEIDAASNRGIDEIRDLRDKVNLAPSQSAHKFYIIDEVHQLTTEAFNALLKTLEEPPSHAVFVLASTEAHKIPATILSRCQRFDFRRIAVHDIQARLEHICVSEGIVAEPAALEVVARAATGSLRDAESILDQLSAYVEGEITIAEVESLLGTGGIAAVGELVSLLFRRDLAGGLRLINRLADEGTDMRQLAREIVDYLRSLLLVKTEAQAVGTGAGAPEATATLNELAATVVTEDLLRALRGFSQLDASIKGLVQPQLPLELAFAEFALGQAAAAHAGEARQAATEGDRRLPPRPAAVPPQAAPTAVPRPQPTAASAARGAPKVEQVAAAPAPPSAATASQGEAVAPAEAGPLKVSVDALRQLWPSVLEAVGRGDRKVQALLRDCLGPDRIDDRTVVLGFAHAFHKDQVCQDKNRSVVEASLSGIVGQACLIRCELATRQTKPRQESVLEDPLVREALSQGGRIKGLKTTSETENAGNDA